MSSQQHPSPINKFRRKRLSSGAQTQLRPWPSHLEYQSPKMPLDKGMWAEAKSQIVPLGLLPPFLAHLSPPQRRYTFLEPYPLSSHFFMMSRQRSHPSLLHSKERAALLGSCTTDSEGVQVSTAPSMPQPPSAGVEQQWRRRSGARIHRLGLCFRVCTSVCDQGTDGRSLSPNTKKMSSLICLKCLWIIQVQPMPPMRLEYQSLTPRAQGDLRTATQPWSPHR